MRSIRPIQQNRKNIKIKQVQNPHRPRHLSKLDHTAYSMPTKLFSYVRTLCLESFIKIFIWYSL